MTDMRAGQVADSGGLSIPCKTTLSSAGLTTPPCGTPSGRANRIVIKHPSPQPARGPFPRGERSELAEKME
jgi:hypothetical protein